MINVDNTRNIHEKMSYVQYKKIYVFGVVITKLNNNNTRAVCLSVSELSTAVKAAFKYKEKLQKIAVAVHVLRKPRIWSFYVGPRLQRHGKRHFNSDFAFL